jgi:polar amino acid transport system substrate-binding protein
MSRVRLLPLAMLLSVLAAGCGANADHAEREALAALAVKASSSSSSSTPATVPQCNVSGQTSPVTNSIPSGSDLAAIEHRGRLIVGVDQNTRLLSYWNPLTGRFNGFEIDLARQLAEAIFHNPNAVRFRALTTDERTTAVEDNEVDMSIDAITITPERKQEVCFSSVYFLAHQRLLVPVHSPVRSARGLTGRWVCATKGSTSLTTIQAAQPRAHFDPVQQRTDCLLALEEGWVSAVTSDDAILRGFQVQDRLTRIVGPSLAPEPYGIAINKHDPELVRFVNGVLAQMRVDGVWQRLYAHWFHAKATPPPAAYDG